MKEYLGDNVHAEFDGEQLTLTSDHEEGDGPSATIHLNDDVCTALSAFINRTLERLKGAVNN